MRFAAWLLVGCWSVGYCSGIVAVDSVRVRVADGVPRIEVDGQPVRARIFWGGPGSRPIRVTDSWQEVAFDFTPAHDEPERGTMHLRFGQVPGEIVVDNLQVTSLDGKGDVIPNCDFERGISDFERDWTYWPRGAANTVGEMQVVPGIGRDGSQGLRIQLHAPASGEWPDFHVYHHPNLALRRGERYRVRMWVRATPARDLTIAFYRPGTSFLQLGGPPNVLESQVRLAAAAGVNLVSFPVELPWPEPGKPVDWEVVDQQCAMVLRANPEALLLPRIWVGAPAWWCRQHPDEVMKWDDQGNHAVDACVESPAFLQEAGERLRALVEHLEATFGPHMAGYHPTGQNTGEWFYHDTWGAGLNGYSPATEIAWRQWLRERYPTDQALQAAWRDPTATLIAATVPTAAARRSSPAGILHNPETERRLIDFAEFQQQAMARCVRHFAHVVRVASRGKRLVLMFYGYVHEFGAITNGPATSGHYALREVLESPDIDILCSPISYFDRGLGQNGPAMTAAESVALAGKMWLVEDDTRTYLGTGSFPGWMDGAKDLADTNKLLLRNTTQCAVRHFATWWMDLGSTGWFDDPRMWEVMRQLEALDRDLLTTAPPYRPEVAAVVDEASMLRVAAGGSVVTRPAVYESRGALGRLGAPYGQYLLDDVVAGRVRAKLYVFANAWSLSSSQRQALQRATAGATRVWCYAPGYLEPDRASIPAMRELTGFALRPLLSERAVATPTSAGRQLGLGRSWGSDRVIVPLFAAADATDSEVIATYPSGEAGVAIRRGSSGTDVFVGVPEITSDLLRGVARQAGVRLWVDQDCHVYANGPYVILHAATDGAVTLHVGRDHAVLDYWTGQHIGNGPDISLTMTKGDTRVLKTESRAPAR